MGDIRDRGECEQRRPEAETLLPQNNLDLPILWDVQHLGAPKAPEPPSCAGGGAKNTEDQRKVSNSNPARPAPQIRTELLVQDSGAKCPQRAVTLNYFSEFLWSWIRERLG